MPIVAVIASQLRQLIKVGSAGRGSSAQLAKSLGMAPWQVDKARRAVGHWSADGLAIAVQAIAAADHEVKGGGRDPVYAVERAILDDRAGARRRLTPPPGIPRGWLRSTPSGRLRRFGGEPGHW